MADVFDLSRFSRRRHRVDVTYQEVGEVLDATLGDDRDAKTPGLQIDVAGPDANEFVDLIGQGTKCGRCLCDTPEPPSPASCLRILAECGGPSGLFPAEVMGKPRQVVAKLICDGFCPICAFPMTPEAHAKFRRDEYWDGMPTREQRTIRKTTSVTIGHPRTGNGRRARRT